MCSDSIPDFSLQTGLGNMSKSIQTYAIVA
jgi:hypothetical protein